MIKSTAVFLIFLFLCFGYSQSLGITSNLTVTPRITNGVFTPFTPATYQYYDYTWSLPDPTPINQVFLNLYGDGSGFLQFQASSTNSTKTYSDRFLTSLLFQPNGVLYQLPLTIQLDSSSSQSDIVGITFNSIYYESYKQINCSFIRGQYFEYKMNSNVCKFQFMMECTNPNQYGYYWTITENNIMKPYAYTPSGSISYLVESLSDGIGYNLTIIDFNGVNTFDLLSISPNCLTNTQTDVSTSVQMIFNNPLSMLFIGASTPIESLTLKGIAYNGSSVFNTLFQGAPLSVILFNANFNSANLIITLGINKPINLVQWGPNDQSSIFRITTQNTLGGTYYVYEPTKFSALKNFNNDISFWATPTENGTSQFSYFQVDTSDLVKYFPGLDFYRVKLPEIPSTSSPFSYYARRPDGSEYSGTCPQPNSFTLNSLPPPGMEVSSLEQQSNLEPITMNYSIRYTEIYQQFNGAVKYGLFSGNNLNLPLKTIPFEYPFHCFGYPVSLQYMPRIPVLNDLPKDSILQSIIFGDDNQDTLSQIEINLSSNNVPDLIPPIASVTLSYNNSISDGFYDIITVIIDDTIGIDYDNCLITYGPLTFNLNHSSKFQGSDSGSQFHVFKFQTNRYFCTEDVQFYCEDLRGNSIQWSKNDLGSFVATFLSQNDANCIESAPFVNNFKIMSIQSTFDPEVRGSYYFSLMVYLLDDKSNYTFTLFLNEEPTGIPFIYNSTTGQFYTSSIALSNSQTITYHYSLQITNSKYPNQIITLSNDELKYISSNSILPFDTFITYGDHYIEMLQNVYNAVLDSTTEYQLNFAGQGIKNITMAYIGSTFFGVRYLSFTPTLSSQIIQIMSVPSYGHMLWLENVCDIYDNCITLNPREKSLPTTVVATYPPPIDLNSNTIVTLSATPNLVNVSLQNRKSRFEFNLKSSSIKFDKNLTPILYIVENQSMFKLKYPMILMKSTSDYDNTYFVDIELPVNFGTRGIYKCFIYNITCNDQLTGFEFDNTFNIVHTADRAVYWGAYITSDKPTQIYISGSNLGNSGEDTLTLISGSASVVLHPKYYNNTSLYAVIPSGFDLSQAQLYSQTYGKIQLLIQTCAYKTCSGHGTCQSGTCVCFSGYDGYDCSINTQYTCPNNCSNNGVCINQVCNCTSNFVGPTCSTPANNGTVINNNPNNPSSSVGTNSTETNSDSNQTTFKIEMSIIEELNYSGTTIHQFNLDQWSLNSSSPSSNVYTTVLKPGSLVTVTSYYSDSEPKTFEFAGSTITIPPHSVKYNIRIDNYPFDSSLNQLKLVWMTSYTSPNPCVTDQQDTEFGGSDLNDVHYVVLSANELQLYGRFSNLIESDGHTLLSSNQAILSNDQVIVNLTVPFFQNSVQLDPDFSLLINYNSVSDDMLKQCKKGLPTYALIIIIVVCSLVGLALISIGLAVLYRRNITFRLSLLKIKKAFQPKSSRNIKLTEM